MKNEEGFRFPRPAQPPAPPGVGSASKPTKSPLTANPLSPTSKEPSSTTFKFPAVPRDEQGAQAPVGLLTSRRDSLFAESHARLLSKLNQVNSDREEKTPSSAQAQSAKEIEASPSVEKRREPMAPVVVESIVATDARRPSPVKFTSDRPEQFPLKPEPERPTKAADGPKILSLENLDNFLAKDDMTDFEKEEVNKQHFLGEGRTNLNFCFNPDLGRRRGDEDHGWKRAQVSGLQPQHPTYHAANLR